jgi:hypothetical protein
MWPEEFNFILDEAEEVTLEVPHASGADGSPHAATQRRALRVEIVQQDYERVWPLADTRFRLGGRFAGKAITMIVNNPLYHQWHPADGGTRGEAGDPVKLPVERKVVVHFLLDDVRETAPA